MSEETDVKTRERITQDAVNEVAKYKGLMWGGQRPAFEEAVRNLVEIAFENGRRSGYSAGYDQAREDHVNGVVE